MRNPFRASRDTNPDEHHDLGFDDLSDPDDVLDPEDAPRSAAVAEVGVEGPAAGPGEVPGEVPDISDILAPRPILSSDGVRSREVSGPGHVGPEGPDADPGAGARKWGPPETTGRSGARTALATTPDDAELDDAVLDDAELAARAIARNEAIAEQKSAWTYLGVVTGLFLVLVVFGYGCSDQRSVDEVVAEQPGVVGGVGQQTSLVLTVDGDVITLDGLVPDQAAKDQLIGVAETTYGAENVVDQLVVDDGTTLDGGTIRIVGSANLDDERPAGILEQISGDFGLANRGNEVAGADSTLTPVAATMTVDNERVTLNGVLPDDQSIVDLVATAGEVWGPDNVDGSGLAVGATTWTDGLITMVGSASSTDERPETFVGLVPTQIGTLVTVDTAALETVDDDARRLEIQTEINDLVEANPIQFAPTLADIDPESDDTLVELAGLLEQVPSSSLEIVGYTDSVGNDQANLVLSEDRATAVVERLVELGIAEERMTSRGEGENDPIGDNSTDAGRAQNRRIEFTLVGADAGDGDGESESTDG